MTVGRLSSLQLYASKYNKLFHVRDKGEAEKGEDKIICIPNNAEICEPGHEKMCLMSYANKKGEDQPAHPRSLIRAFVVRSLISAFVLRCLDSIISLDSIAEI